MIVLRRKTYSDQPSSQDLLLENMKMQRQIVQTQRMREKIQAQETRDRLRTIQTAQRLDQKRDEQLMRNMTKAKKMEMDEGAQNVGLYKTRSKATDPVPMD